MGGRDEKKAGTRAEVLMKKGKGYKEVGREK